MDRTLLRVLVAEDAEDDAKIALRHLERGGFAVRAERELAERERRLRAIIETEPECVKLVSAEGRLLEMNPAGLAMLEAGSLAEVQARPLLEFIRPEHREAFVALHRQVIGGERGTLEFEVEGLKGGRHWLETHAAPLPGVDCNGTMLLGITRDVTGRRRADAALRESEAGLRQAQRVAQLGYGITRSDSTLESWSETLPLLVGVEHARMPKSVRQWMALIHPEDQARFRDAGIAAARTGERFDIEYRLRRGDGAWVVLRHVVDPLPDDAAAGVKRWFNTVQDITERKRAEQALRASNEQLRMLVESSPLAIYTRDREGLLTSWNPAAEKMFGWKAAEVLGKPLPSVPQAARAESDRLRMRLLGGGQLINHAGERRRSDGSTIHIDSFVGPLRDGAGGTTGIIAVVADVTEQKRAEQALRESEARFRSLTALSSDWYWEQDEHFRFVSISSEVARAAGTSAESLIGKTRWELPAVGLSDEVWASHRLELGAHRPFRDFEYQRTNDRGETVWMSASGEPVFDAAGRFTGYRGVGREITTRKQAEDRVRRLNRVYAVLSGINTLIVRGSDREELFREACRIAVEAGEFRMAWLGIVNRGTRRI